MKNILIALSIAFYFWSCHIVRADAPSGLMTDLLEHTDRVWLDGYPSTLELAEINRTIERYQTATIHNKRPAFSWIVNDSRNNIKQTAYQILVGANRAKLEKNEADLWDSGKIDSDASVAVYYAGKDLPLDTVVYWKVKTWNNDTEQPFSKIKAFLTAKNLVDYQTAVYPLQKSRQTPQQITPKSDHIFVDFGKAAFGQLCITATCLAENQEMKIHFGEASKDGRINRKAGGTIRYAVYRLKLLSGTHTYTVKFMPNNRNTGSGAIKMPSYIGEVLPFRYVEIENLPAGVRLGNIEREMVHYPFDETKSNFTSSDEILNQVWELCKYSIKATSFCGKYVDGDRERIPYEADALINQLSHYGVDREYSIARTSHEYLIQHATWPTEWILQSVLMAYHDYQYTGDTRSLEVFYQDLHAKLLLPLADPETGLISTRTGKQTPELMKSIHYNSSKLRDIVDWPQSGILGLGKSEGGEADGFAFKQYNAVVNAYHYQALTQMARMAEVLGKNDDAKQYAELAAKVKKSYYEKFFDPEKGYFIDGFDQNGKKTEHAALHSNMFPLAFDMIPETNRQSVMQHIKSRGMACSVYGSQFLMDAIYNAGEAKYGLSLLASDAERSWYNMIRVGSTISLEAWDNKYKPNQDWNHAWGAAPANIIPRKLVGIEPLEAGFKRVRFKPQPSDLKSFSATVPTIRGDINVTYDRSIYELTIPANMEVEVVLPSGKTQTLGSGKHKIEP